MKKYKIKPISGITKEINIPSDKSISHRAVILASLCEGKTRIKHFLQSDDTRITLDCMKKLGVTFKLQKEELTVVGAGMYLNPKTKKMPVTLFAGNSGTTMRILCGLLCCQKFPVIFDASNQLSNRPMARITHPLNKMGADISGVFKINKANESKDVYPPLNIKPVETIKSGEFNLEIASAQIKSAIMLAALYANGETRITEPYKSRDHTERMLRLFGADIKTEGKTVICNPVKKLFSPKELSIPGDFSSAAFFVVLGLILKNSALVIKDVNINPTRCGLLKVLERMGANIEIKNERNEYEQCADIIVKSSKLKATIVEPSEIPSMIDEIPILCVASTFAEGQTEIRGIKELKVKETDRVNSMIDNLSLAGVNIVEEPCDGDCKIKIKGGNNYSATNKFESYRDHRTAMSMIIFAMALSGQSEIDDITCIDKSFPTFISLIKSLSK